MPNDNLLNKYQIFSTVEECDIAIVPVDIGYFYTNKNQGKLDNFINKALALGKKVWVYSGGDYGKSLESSVHTFRMSGFDSKMNQQTFIMPSFIGDPYVKLSKNFHTIAKLEQPQIGFVGHASNSLSKKIKEISMYLNYNFKRWTKKTATDYYNFYPSSIKRFQLLAILKKNPDLKTNFIFRNKYRAGIKSLQQKNKTTIEFLENIEKNPYTFCLRGAGNFSVRFYETLAMGRIPFVIDTDFRLPLSDTINWKKHCVIAKEQEMVDTIIDFHQNISPEDFELMQINNQKLWKEYLEREAYFLKIHSVFKLKTE
ncbi:hypothetical protein GON26_09130 [Flavobacterium sp. GA093]|uniref:Exostosin GT47 domain-containing protein n=1 Tax=Flavobacterium hydrocarbonoxydans TaxID=2683249 RepID=A0A6I4NJ54_9FLAO|nr:exostosin family protein [Flavobacterium hydrocarbonoxydans]MWB94526.1 hypothetical protein [Flavobacterium hydrocarbonoxydans]